MLHSWKMWNATDKKVWLGWIGSFTIGWLLLLGLFVLNGIAGIDSDPAGRDFPPLDHIFVENTIFCACIPCVVGVVQWLLLRNYIRTWSWSFPLWVVATTIGWTGVITLILRPPPGLSLTLIWIIGGLLTAILQWLVLQLYHPRAIWWPVVHMGILLILLVLARIVPGLTIIAGILYGAGSGFTVVVLFHVPVRSSIPPSRATRWWFWRPAVLLLLFFGLSATMLMSFRAWRVLWYLNPPPPPIFASAADVIAKNVGGRGAIALVIRFPPPTRGHQEQVTVLETTHYVYREPVDTFWFTLRSAQLTPNQVDRLTLLRHRWCATMPTFPVSRTADPSYDVGFWCGTPQQAKSIQIPSDRVPAELDAIIQTVAGSDTYK
jgi:hypothetical protein